MKKREIQEINASSMADISFLLLIFFLVTTSMATDKGLFRTLPPPVEKKEIKEKVEVNQRDVMLILVNSNDLLMVNGEVMDVNKLKDKAKEFIANPSNNPDLPAKEAVNVPLLGGTQMVTTKHVISLQNDRGTSYQAYLSVQNELVAAYDELRDELSSRKFGKLFVDLSKEEQDAVKVVYPQKISEAEPKSYGGAQ